MGSAHGSGSTKVMTPRTATVSWSLIGAFALVLVAGYAGRWRWTGFQQDRQLWDLLHLVVLPAVLATLPLWFRTRASWRRAWHLLFGLVAVAFTVLVIGGYALGWTWTGFQGNTLWDWLELLALPVVVALLPLWFETHRRMEREWRVAFALVAAALAVSIIGGYALGWTWTGFQGNTLLQWVRMLFVPFILPASIAWYSTQSKLIAEAAAAAGTSDDPQRVAPPAAGAVSPAPLAHEPPALQR